MNNEKITSLTSSASAAASIMGSWQICHNICLGAISILSIMGIAVAGMPLMFLTTLAVPFWSAAVFLLAITMFMYIKKKCISKNLIILNGGLVLAGTPFWQQFSLYFWIVGGMIAVSGLYLLIVGKMKYKQKLNKRLKR